MANPVQPFKNLYYLAEGFAAHNFDGKGNQALDPGTEVEEAFRLPGGHRTQTWNLFGVLSYSLSRECFDAFLRHYRGPATFRDYALSKLYQFLIHAFAERVDDPQRALEAALASAFPPDSGAIERIAELDWNGLFDLESELDIDELVAGLGAFLPPVEPSGRLPVRQPISDPPTAVKASPKRPIGRPPIDIARKRAAYEAALQGRTYRDCAKKLYGTPQPTADEGKNTERIVKRFAKQNGLTPPPARR